MENDYRITKLHGTLIGDNRIPDLPVGEKTKVFSSTNGKTAWVDLPEGGASVSPCLNLMDLTADPPTVRTTITEEEKNNIANRLYTSVFYGDISTPTGDYSIHFPETAVTIGGEALIFSVYNILLHGDDVDTGTLTIPSSSVYTLSIGEKNTDGTYSITIEKSMTASFGASVSPCLNLMNMEDSSVRTSITEEEKTNLENGLYNSVLYADLSKGEEGYYSIYFPESITYLDGAIIFSIYDTSLNEATQSISITGSSIYSLEIGEQNEDKSYPIAINKAFIGSFGGGGGGAIQEIEAIKSTEDGAEANQYTLSSTPTSPMYMMKVKNDDGSYSRITMILQSLGTSAELYFGCRIVSFLDTNTCVYAYSAGNIAILTNQCYLPPEIKDGDVGKVLVAGGNGYVLEDLPSSLPNISQSDIGKYLVVNNNQEASWQNLPESTSTIIRRW